jgi:predicted hydrolase (HD superfamily)
MAAVEEIFTMFPPTDFTISFRAYFEQRKAPRRLTLMTSVPFLFGHAQNQAVPNDASIVNQNIKNPQMVKHMLATEAVMRALARRFGEDEDRWGLAGLLHDADAEIASSEQQGLVVPKSTGDGLAPVGKHSTMPAQGLLVPKLTQDSLDEESTAAIASHNPYTGIKPKGRMGWALYSADPLTGLIVASALVLPGKKLAALTAQSVLKRFAEARFAKGATGSKLQPVQS